VKQAIAGWDQGIVGMQVGGKRRLTIPPNYAYGEKGVKHVIPPNETLTYDIDLISTKDDVSQSFPVVSTKNPKQK